MQLVCPACGAKNHVSPERIADQPLCGRCRAEIDRVTGAMSAAALRGWVAARVGPGAVA